MASAAALARWALPHLNGPAVAGPWVDVGVGPLGVGPSQFAGRRAGSRTVGVDPLPLAPIDLHCGPALVAALRELRAGSYEHVISQGERLPFGDAEFAVAVAANMLDHVQDPVAIMSEAHRVVRPGGMLLVACDVHSALGRLKFEHVTKRRVPDGILVRAHPWRFTAPDLESLIVAAGFRIIAAEALAPRFVARTVARSRYAKALAVRP